VILGLKDTVRPLLVSPLGAVISFVAFGVTPGNGVLSFVFLFVMTWVYAIAAALVLVVPVWIIVPKLRQPPAWLAIVWGMIAALLMASVMFPSTPRLAVPVLAAGAASGLVYSIAARRINSRAV
jgi:hypothetical protein